MAIWLQYTLVAIGGALGATLRFAIEQGSQRWYGGQFPLGTLMANLLGCLIIGILLGSGMGQRFPGLRLGLGVGFLGALTTFSTFKAEIWSHLQEGSWTLALANVGISLVAGLAMVALGAELGKRWF